MYKLFIGTEMLQKYNFQDVFLYKNLTLNSKDVYLTLISNSFEGSSKELSLHYINEKLNSVSNTYVQLPDKLEDLESWVVSNSIEVGKEYQQYLYARSKGVPRSFFRNKSHALNFIKSIAPTKLVDGAWLFSATNFWNDARFSSLIKIYLEELGDGNEKLNHVSIYRKLLEQYGLNDWKSSEQEYFEQGAIQIALANCGEEFLPEILGFNLGYEQLPLHLLITSYELNELGIDPFYFTLHITIDNSSSGHGKEAVDAVKENAPKLGSYKHYFERIRRGFALNNIGIKTKTILDNFDLYKELCEILFKKAELGQFMHSNRCVIHGKSINEWLTSKTSVCEFIEVLEKTGWIKRHENPENSRFWKILGSNNGSMYGVFSSYEKQVIYDWIAGEFIPKSHLKKHSNVYKLNVNSLKPALQTASNSYQSLKSLNDVISSTEIPTSEFRSGEEILFIEKIKTFSNKDQVMNYLQSWINPVNHHTTLGLLATKLYIEFYYQNNILNQDFLLAKYSI